MVSQEPRRSLQIACIEQWNVGLGVQHQENVSGVAASEMGGNQKAMRKRKILLAVRLLNNSNMLSLHVLPHLFCVIETKNLVCIVDQHVEMPQEASTQKPTNLRVRV